MSSEEASVKMNQEAKTRIDLSIFARCPKCGSTHVDIPSQLRFFASITSRVVGCGDCGHLGNELQFIP